MDAPRILLGLLLIAAIAGPAAAAAWKVVGRLSPRPLTHRVLATSVIALTLVLVPAQLLGALGLFAPGPLVVAGIVVAIAVVALSRRLGPASPATKGEAPAASVPRAVTAVALLLSGAVFVRWLAVVITTYGSGLTEFDTRHYHLAFASDFVRSGSITGFVPVWPDPVHNFHPLSAELLHAIGMLAMDRDVLVPMQNLGWLALLLLAGWCVGSRKGVAPLTLLAVTWVAGVPLLIGTNSSTAVNDIAVIAFLVCAVAAWRTADGDRGWLFVAALALGLALGAKLTSLACVLALVIAFVVLSPRERRLRLAGLLAAGIGLVGSFWYLRNLVRAGSPIPPARLPFLPATELPVVNAIEGTVGQYLLDGKVWREVLRPGLSEVFGRGVLLGIAGCAAGLAVLARSRDRALLALAATGLFGLAAHLVNPAGAIGGKGEPFLFAFAVNLRYVLPGLALLAVACALATAAAHPRLRLAFAVLVGAAVCVDLTRTGRLLKYPDASELKALVVVVAVAAVAVVIARVPLRPRWRWSLAAAALLIVVVAAGPHVTRKYLAGATRSDSAAEQQVFSWAAAQQHVRIGYSGLGEAYPMRGPAWENHVEYIGIRGERGAFRTVASCEEYARLLDRSRLDYVVLSPAQLPVLKRDLAGWTQVQPGITRVLEAPPFTVFRLGGTPDPRRCARLE